MVRNSLMGGERFLRKRGSSKIFAQSQNLKSFCNESWSLLFVCFCISESCFFFCWSALSFWICHAFVWFSGVKFFGVQGHKFSNSVGKLGQCSTTCILRSHLLCLLLMLHLLDSILLLPFLLSFAMIRSRLGFSKIVEVLVSDFQAGDSAYWQILDLTLCHPFINKDKS